MHAEHGTGTLTCTRSQAIDSVRKQLIGAYPKALAKETHTDELHVIHIVK